ncbi:MAG: RidA family protein, partial [Chitinophagales bacterium]
KKIMRQNFSSGTEWEKNLAYSRAVRVGNIIKVAGTTAVDENGSLVGAGDTYEQCRYIFKKIKDILEKAGSAMEHVVLTRIYLTNMDDWEKAGRAHYEVFKEIHPVATMIEVSRLIRPDLLVEIEVEAAMHY